MKPLRVIALIGALGLMAWFLAPSASEAYPYPLCQNVNGTYCFTQGQTGYCWQTPPGQAALCTCGYYGISHLTWRCPPPVSNPSA
jgi:hypothetical protein